MLSGKRSNTVNVGSYGFEGYENRFMKNNSRKTIFGQNIVGGTEGSSASK